MLAVGDLAHGSPARVSPPLLLFRAVLIGAAQHDVGHLHLATGRTPVHDLDDVVSETGAHGLADLPDGGVVGRTFEGIDHLQGAELAQIATVLGGAGVIGAPLLLGHGGKVLTVDDAIAQGDDLLPSHQRILRGGLRRHLHQDVAGAHLLEGYGRRLRA